MKRGELTLLLGAYMENVNVNRSLGVKEWNIYIPIRYIYYIRILPETRTELQRDHYCHTALM